MSANFGAGFHVAPGRAVDASAYDRFTGRWSRLFVPAVLAAAEVSSTMLEGARARLQEPLFWPVSADGQALPFRDGSFDAVTCQLGLQFFPDPALGLRDFRRVLRVG